MKKDYPVALLCRVMNVSRSGFYRHQRSYKRHARLSAERLSLLQLVRRVAHEHRYSYGSRGACRWHYGSMASLLVAIKHVR